MSQYQKGKTNLDFTEARDSEWQWHQLDRMQVCTSLQTDNHASTPPLKFFTGRMPLLRPTNSVKALKAFLLTIILAKMLLLTALTEPLDKNGSVCSKKKRFVYYSDVTLTTARSSQLPCQNHCDADFPCLFHFVAVISARNVT